MTADVLVLSRLFHLGSGLMLVAVVAFRWLILLPSWKGANRRKAGGDYLASNWSDYSWGVESC